MSIYPTIPNMPRPELQDMVVALKQAGFLHGPRVEKAMLAVDRVYFVPPGHRAFAYEDQALPLFAGQTISAPTVVAFMLEKLDIQPGMKILEIGTGSGYNTALLAELAGKKGTVISMEIVPELHGLAQRNLAKLPKKYPQLKLLCQDGSHGYPPEAPYDRITVTAAMPSLPPGHPLIRQLKPDGKLIAPVGGSGWEQDLILYDHATRSSQRILPVLFVPLTGKGEKE